MLTDPAVRQAKPRASRYEIKDASRPGLRLVVHPSGVKSFVFRYTLGKYRKVTLGTYPTMTLAQAIAAHRAAADALVARKDPAVAIKAKRGGEVAADDTVTAYAELYRRLHVATLSAGTAAYVKIELDRVTDALGAKDIRAVTQHDAQAIVDGAMKRGESARNTTYKCLKAFFAWAAGRVGVESPCAKIERPSKDRTRDRYLDDDEIRVLWTAADAAGGVPAALCKLLLLTGCRRNEVTHLERSEVKGASIELPGERTKNGRPHSVPITPMIRAVLDTLPKSGKFALTGAAKGVGGHAKARKKIKTPTLAHWRFHDLRRTFASGLARLGVPIQVTERCLNHVSGVSANPLVKIYQQHDYQREVRDAFEKWSAHVDSLVTEKMKAAA
jgi:integrase